MILTLDLGTSVIKAGLWERGRAPVLAGVAVETAHPAPGWAEQDPDHWSAGVAAACAELRRRDPEAYRSVEAVGCTGARQTFALFDRSGGKLGPALVWSDRRATAEAATLAAAADRAGDGGPDVPPEAGSVAAKVAWLASHQPERLAAAAWILAPRDAVVWWLTGEVVTDTTMASRSGLYDPGGAIVEGWAGAAAGRLAPVVPPDRVVGGVSTPAAATLGLAAGTPVVIGAADRPSEVVGTGATERCPMVSWGTTANLSVPLPGRPDRPPSGVVLSRAADGRWLAEGGLSAAGSWLAWLADLCGRTPEALAALATTSPPGARGVVATPWLEGARAPWWRPEAGAAFLGLGPAHGAADLARAAVESVAWEVARCLDAVAARRPAGPPVEALALAGGGAARPVWVEALTGITGHRAVIRRSGQAASAGAALLAASALGRHEDLDGLDPVERWHRPGPDLVETYAAGRPGADRAAAAVLGLSPPGSAPCG